MKDWSKLRFYIFDWDDNVLYMDTRINVEECLDGQWAPRALATHEYAAIRAELGGARYRYPHTNDAPDYERAYAEFNDQPGVPSPFVRDTALALANEQFAPSFACFKECILDGSLFMICTARAHQPVSLRRGVEYFIRQHLSGAERGRMYTNLAGYYAHFKSTPVPDRAGLLDWYLDRCGFIPISSAEFNGTLGTPCTVEIAKSIAVDRFVAYATGLFHKHAAKISRISIGFSDDDAGNVRAIAKLFRSHVARDFPNVAFHVYSTANKTKENVAV